MDLIISSQIIVRENRVLLNNIPIFQDEPSKPVTVFLKTLYKHLNLDYTKYFKMDALCKLGFLAAEVLLQHEQVQPDDLAIVFANSGSSLDTDKKYQLTIQDSENYFPSPALFVYTLPNILIGEISIRHSLTGESMFFISEKFNPEILVQYSLHLIQQELAQSVLCGWIELMDDQYEAVMFFGKKVEGTNENSNFDAANLQRLYNS